MNTLQLSPLGATAPPASPGKPAAAAEALSFPSKKTGSKPDIAVSDSGASPVSTDQQLTEARSQTVQAASERKAQVEKTQAEKARAAKEAAEAREAEEEAVTLDIGTLDREIGLVEGTTKVFVDLVDPVHKKSLFRVFGPPEKASEPPATAPTEVKNAYTRTGAPLPLKDLGVA
jgi:hypothetical protein